MIPVPWRHIMYVQHIGTIWCLLPISVMVSNNHIADTRLGAPPLPPSTIWWVPPPPHQQILHPSLGGGRGGDKLRLDCRQHNFHLLVYGYRKKEEKKSICIPLQLKFLFHSQSHVLSPIASLRLLDVYCCDWMRRMQTLLELSLSVR